MPWPLIDWQGSTAQSGIASQLADVLSRARSPIWMDSSTTDDCRAIEAAVGGASTPCGAHRLSCVRALHRPADSQVRAGRSVGLSTNRQNSSRQLVDGVAPGRRTRADRQGRRLRHEPDGGLAAGRWSRAALDATAPDLDSKLAPLVPSSNDCWNTVALTGCDASIYPAARIAAWSGDNLCSLVGTGLVSGKASRDLARHQRHDLRRDVEAIGQPGWHRPRLRVAHEVSSWA